MPRFHLLRFPGRECPPLRWFSTVAARFPQLTFDIFAGYYLLDFQVSAHAANVEILQEEVTSYDDSDSQVEYESPDYLAEMLTDFPLSEALLSGVEPSADSVLAPGDRDHILSGVFNQFLSAAPRASRINKKSANNPALID